MPADGKVRTLQVLPSRSADLCFSVPGVIALQNYDHQTGIGPAYLGQTVQEYKLPEQLYAHLNETVTDQNDTRYPGDPQARLKYDSAEIHKTLATTPSPATPAPFLFALRNQTIAAALDQAVARREGMYFERFKHGADIQQAMTQAFPVILNSLAQLQVDATNRFNAVEAAHAASSSPPVITETKTTTSVSSDYKVSTTTKQRNMVSVNGEFDAPDDKELETRILDVQEPDTNKQHVQTHKSDRLTGFPYTYDPAPADPKKPWKPVTTEYVPDAQVSDTTTEGKQISTAENPAFFHPRLDNKIAHHQLLSGAAGEAMNQTIASLSASHMTQIVADEQAATDYEVRRLQITFAETYLTAPFPGVVTAVFKDVGECVQAGEPILRVENDAVVFLVGRIQYFGLLRVGQSVTVRAKDLFESGQTADIVGKIRGIRGHEADDDEWDVVIECTNPVDGSGRRKLPIYYQFDRDTTKVVVP